MNQKIIKEWQEAGQQWLKGKIIDEIHFRDKKFKLLEPQIKFVNNKKRFVLYSGGYGCGKTIALLIKMILLALFFPKNMVLLGRKTLQDIERTTLPDFFDLLPPRWYKHHIKQGIIDFFNGSKIVLFGLDALQSGNIKDIKKAQQKIKSLNLGAYFIDQLEEIEKRVFISLNARLRRAIVPIRQGNMTTNPANYWAYHFFKKNEEQRDDIELIEGSTLDNKKNLPKDYVNDLLKNDENYVKRFVYGIWSPDVLIQNVVFANEYIQRLEAIIKKPIAIEEGCEIWEQPDVGTRYQMGIDSSTGEVDPSSISVISDDGKKVAKFRGWITIPALIEKTKFLYYKYGRPLIIPEANASGVALIEGIKDLKVYIRTVFSYREKRELKKLGWRTTYGTKKLLISNFQNLLRQNFPQIYDRNTIEEMKTFVWSDEPKQKGAGAQKGFHDDDLISTMLGFWGLTLKTRNENIEIELERRRRASKRFKLENYI